MTQTADTCAEYQAAHDYPWLEALSNWDFADAVLCPYQTAIGGPEFATMILGAVGMAYAIKQGSFAISAVVLVVAGGAFAGQLLGPALGIVTTVLLAILSAVPVLIVRRMGR